MPLYPPESGLYNLKPLFPRIRRITSLIPVQIRANKKKKVISNNGGDFSASFWRGKSRARAKPLRSIKKSSRKKYLNLKRRSPGTVEIAFPRFLLREPRRAILAGLNTIFPQIKFVYFIPPWLFVRKMFYSHLEFARFDKLEWRLD